MTLHRKPLRGSVLRPTSRQMLALTLEELRTYLDELIENSPVAILMLDPEHRVQLCNPAFERLFQYKRAELRNANLEDLITFDELTKEAVKIWKRVLRGEKVYAA